MSQEFSREEFLAFKGHLYHIKSASFKAFERAGGDIGEWDEGRRELIEKAEAEGFDLYHCFAYHNSIASSWGFEDTHSLDLPGELSLEAYYQRILDKFAEHAIAESVGSEPE